MSLLSPEFKKNEEMDLLGPFWTDTRLCSLTSSGWALMSLFLLGLECCQSSHQPALAQFCLQPGLLCLQPHQGVPPLPQQCLQRG